MAYDDPGSPYLPANGTEGDDFLFHWCWRCIHEDGPDEDGEYDGKKCEILTRTYLGETVDEWVYGADGEPRCTAWRPRPPTPKPYRCPATLDLFEVA